MNVDTEKRKLLKLLGIGSLGLVLGQLLDSKWGSALFGEVNFRNFKLVESKKDLKLFTRSGEEIVTFEKE